MCTGRRPASTRSATFYPAESASCRALRPGPSVDRSSPSASTRRSAAACSVENATKEDGKKEPPPRRPPLTTPPPPAADDDAPPPPPARSPTPPPPPLPPHRRVVPPAHLRMTEDRCDEYPVSYEASSDPPRAGVGSVRADFRQRFGSDLFQPKRLRRRLVLHGRHLHRCVHPPQSGLRRLQSVHDRQLQRELEQLRECRDAERAMRGLQPLHRQRTVQCGRAVCGGVRYPMSHPESPRL